MDRKKFKRFIILSVGIIITSFIFMSIFNKPGKHNPYFSITLTNKNYQNQYVCYDAKENILEHILTMPDTAQYPLGYTDKLSNKLYYIKKDGNGDQIYAFDIATKKEKKLTTDLYAVNDIFVFKDKIYVLAKIKGQKTISLIEISKNEYKSKVISDLDFNVESISFKKSSSTIYFVGYNMNEQLELNRDYEKNNGGGQLKNATSKLFSYNILKGVVNLEYKNDDYLMQIAVMNVENKALIKLSQDVFTESKFYWFDLEHKQFNEEIFFKDIVRIDDMDFSYDDRYLYLLGVKKTSSYNQNDVTQTAPSNYIYEYKIETKEIKPILTLKDLFMNNFEIVEY